MGANCEILISILSDYWVGVFRAAAKFPKDIIKFPYWKTKSKILESYWEQPDVMVEAYSVSILPDLSSITLKKEIP